MKIMEYVMMRMVLTIGRGLVWNNDGEGGFASGLTVFCLGNFRCMQGSFLVLLRRENLIDLGNRRNFGLIGLSCYFLDSYYYCIH